NAMFEQAKSELDLTSMTSFDTPYLIILGGQPGSGKSSVIEKIEEYFANNIMALNGDDFKTTYPGYDMLLAQDPIKTSEEVQPYSNYVVNQLKNYYANKKINLIIEGTMRTSEVPLSTINEFKDKVYQVEAYVVVANYYASRTGCLFRLEMDIAGNGYGRAVPVESHDAAYKNIPVTMQKLIDSGKLENLTIMSRNGEIIAELRNGNNVVDIYERRRNLLTKSDFNQIKESLSQVVDMMQQRHAGRNEIDKVMKLQEDVDSSYYNQEFTKDLEINKNESQINF
ncbi:MAG TPA: zeta toxin family protein, partial [Aquella sp.]|nr:zeta toxin family protein [Aquella sp.]